MVIGKEVFLCFLLQLYFSNLTTFDSYKVFPLTQKNLTMRNCILILHTEDPLILYSIFASPWYSTARIGFTRRRKIYWWFHCSTRFFNLLDFELQAKAGLAFLTNQLSAEAWLTIWAWPEFGTKNRSREWFGEHQINLAIYPPQLIQCRI